jgi:glycosyltransferase involved in cell wall biosynthesis
MIRIIGYIQGLSGPSYHRIITALLLMKDVEVYVTNNLDVKDFEKGCDVVIFNRIIPSEVIPQLLELKSKYCFKIVCDIDDYWLLDEHHVLYQSYLKDNFAAKQIECINIADIVTVTNDRLADKVKEYNKNVHVIPNAIPKQGQFNIVRTPSKQPRLFWQGSQTHKEDIKILAPVANELYYKYPQCKMVMAGYNGDEQWQSMVRNYTASKMLSLMIIEAQPITNYYESYKEADICLVPLIDSNFNQYKSNLKVLEAANLGLPVICSKVNPYLDLPVLYATNNREWVKHIKTLIESKKAQKEYGKELKDFCDKNFNFEKINLIRKQIFEA